MRVRYKNIIPVESHLAIYGKRPNRKLYLTKEDLKKFPDFVTLERKAGRQRRINAMRKLIFGTTKVK